MRQTSILKTAEVNKKWYVVDATDLVLGRMATQVAMILRGKNKASFTPHLDCGDNVIIINADKIALTGNKWKNKNYYSHSLYPGGLKVTAAKDMMNKKPTFMVERAVRLMLPKGVLGRNQFRNLYVYAGKEHPHAAQQPEVLDLSAKGGRK